MWTEFINETLLPALLTILSAGVTTLVGVAVAAINRWAQKQRQEWVGTVMLNVTLAAQRAVLKTNQVFVDDLRASMADGSSLSREDAKAAMEMAKRTLKAELSDELWQALLRITGSEAAANATLESIIESQVGAVKRGAINTN